MCRSAGTFGTVLVKWSLTYHGLASEADLSRNSQNGTVVFEANETIKYIELTPIQDKLPEVDEAFHITLVESPNASVALGRPIVNREVTIGGLAAVKITILANQEPHGVVSFSKQSLDKTKTISSESGIATFSIVRSRKDDDNNLVGGTIGRIRVDYQITANEDAGSGDLLPQGTSSYSGSVFIEEFDSSQELKIKVADDNEPEPQETFIVNLTSATLLSEVATSVQIKDDGNAALLTVLSSDDYFCKFFFKKTGITKVDEPDSEEDVGEANSENNRVKLTVSRSGGLNKAVTVPFKTAARLTLRLLCWPILSRK